MARLPLGRLRSLLLLLLGPFTPQLGELRVRGARGGKEPRDECHEPAVQSIDDKAEADEEQDGPSPVGRLQTQQGLSADSG